MKNSRYIIMSILGFMLIACPCYADVVSMPMLVTDGTYSDSSGYSQSLVGTEINISFLDPLRTFDQIIASIPIYGIGLIQVAAEIVNPSNTEAGGPVFHITDPYRPSGFDLNYGGWAAISYDYANYFVDAGRCSAMRCVDDLTVNSYTLSLVEIPYPDYYNSDTWYRINLTASRVPEPGTLLLLGSGLAALTAGRKMLMR